MGFGDVSRVDELEINSSIRKLKDNYKSHFLELTFISQVRLIDLTSLIAVIIEPKS